MRERVTFGALPDLPWYCFHPQTHQVNASTMEEVSPETSIPSSRSVLLPRRGPYATLFTIGLTLAYSTSTAHILAPSCMHASVKCKVIDRARFCFGYVPGTYDGGNICVQKPPCQPSIPTTNIDIRPSTHLAIMWLHKVAENAKYVHTSSPKLSRRSSQHSWQRSVAF